ncbi:MoaD/ThiS family protein [Brachybacterium fresconis]|uniref:Molybdopterin converting factor small subunit n=1 Tax=Brachybacterium fresconis TaxID=173363 RepID=A0ABS4YQF0_9MICO|nr:MoaD/ThiS family protein [Brachybacterium fresconis]MBP2410607.1 molybdopterin converting factor small subunit [Brachybacterium fresconis]
MDETTQQTTDTTSAAPTTGPARTAPTPAPAIAVQLFAGAAAEYGAESTTVHGATLQDALDDLLSTASPQAAQVIGRSSFLVGGVACTDHDRALAEGDRLDVLPPFAGG